MVSDTTVLRQPCDKASLMGTSTFLFFCYQHSRCEAKKAY